MSHLHSGQVVRDDGIVCDSLERCDLHTAEEIGVVFADCAKVGVDEGEDPARRSRRDRRIAAPSRVEEGDFAKDVTVTEKSYFSL